MLRARTCFGGMITAPHHLAAEAGLSVLKEGGNAIEAMVSAAATIAVVYPHMNSIGGDGFWLISRKGQKPIGIQACGQAAGLADAAFYPGHEYQVIPSRGARAALTVAGAIGGWKAACSVAKRSGGRLPLARLLEPACYYARDGIAVTASQARLTDEKWPELKDVAGFADTYGPDGPPLEGDRLKQSALASTFERLADAGLDDFYRGDLAFAFAAGLEAAGSPLRLSDLEAYEAKIVEPAEAVLNVGHVFNMPPPTQGVSSLMILRIFERLGVKEAEGFVHVHGMIEAIKRAFILRNAHVGDPDRMGDAWKNWLKDDAIAREAGAIDRTSAAPWPHPATDGDTIWMGAADNDGNVVSYIQSIFWEFGSGLVVPGTGVIWQNRGASFTLGPGPNELGPGRLPFHTLNPAMALLDDGRTLCFGAMGGEGQPQTQAAIFSRHVMFGQDMQQAVTAPRWLLGKTWGASSTNLKLENRFDTQLIADLKQAGHDVEVVGAFEDTMGHAGMVSISQDGLIRGATDPRADGSCAGW